MALSQEEIEVFGLGEFAEILGEQTRGGQELVGAAQLLSQLRGNTTGQQALLKKQALAHPALRPVPPQRINDVQVPIVVFGTAGNTVSATATLQKYFRPEKLIVVEYSNAGAMNNPAQFQILTGAFVGAQNMFPTAPGVGGGIHCGVFAANSLGNGIMWSTAQPAITITLQIQFLGTGTFYGVLFGKTIG